MEQKYLLIFVSIILISLFLFGCNSQKWEIDPEIKKILDQCEDQKIIDMSDNCIEIPQFGTKHSFNIAVSAGIVLWEFSNKLKP